MHLKWKVPLALLHGASLITCGPKSAVRSFDVRG